MLTLAVDTAAEIGSIALADRNGIREEIRLCAPGGFAQTLFGEIEALLACCQVRLADIELYAAASGPGSFTGVRIGLAAIKGLAEVAGKPAIGISNLEALEQFGSADLRAPIIDARPGRLNSFPPDSIQAGRSPQPRQNSPRRLPGWRSTVASQATCATRHPSKPTTSAARTPNYSSRSKARNEQSRDAVKVPQPHPEAP